MAAATTLRAREAEDKRARFGYRRPAARTSPSSSIPLQEGPARAGDDGRASGGAGAASRGRAQRFEDLDGREFEELTLNAAARILAQHHGNMATLRPVQVLEEVQMKVAPVHYSAAADVLLRYPEISGWRLVRVERREGKLVYLRYVRTRVKCPICGKLLQRRSLPSHAFSHLEKLARQGVIKLEHADGKWVVTLGDGRKIYGASWLTLLRLAEIGVVTNG